MVVLLRHQEDAFTKKIKKKICVKYFLLNPINGNVPGSKTSREFFYGLKQFTEKKKLLCRLVTTCQCGQLPMGSITMILSVYYNEFQILPQM